jgi:Zn-dependent protease
MNGAGAGPDAGRLCACGTQIAASLLVCPACHRLAHAGALKDLAARAEAAALQGETQTALGHWRSSLELLPAGSRQFAAVSGRIEALAQSVESAPREVPTSGRWKWIATLGPAGLLIWKFKFLVVVALTKGKLLLLGLTKASTLASMFAAVGVYWTLWGLWFALGVVLSIYVHEMGHVAALRRYGIAATAPMFIPGFGALIRLKQAPLTPREDARIGIAGPVWGLGAAVAALTGAHLGGGPMLVAVARTGAWINLFNLLPIWQLDGSRAFASLTRAHRWLAAAALAAAWMITGDGVVLLVLIVAGFRALTPSVPVEPDRGALAWFAFVALGLALVFRLAQA